MAACDRGGLASVIMATLRGLATVILTTNACGSLCDVGKLPSVISWQTCLCHYGSLAPLPMRALPVIVAALPMQRPCLCDRGSLTSVLVAASQDSLTSVILATLYARGSLSVIVVALPL